MSADLDFLDELILSLDRSVLEMAPDPDRQRLASMRPEITERRAIIRKR